VRKPAELENAYHSATNPAQKMMIAYELAEAEGAHAVTALGRLFQNETDAESKEDILSALWGVNGFDKEKLPIYAAAIRSDQPANVRLEAIENLGDVEETEALYLLQELQSDPSEEIRGAALEAIELVRASLQLD